MRLPVQGIFFIAQFGVCKQIPPPQVLLFGLFGQHSATASVSHRFALADFPDTGHSQCVSLSHTIFQKRRLPVHGFFFIAQFGFCKQDLPPDLISMLLSWLAWEVWLTWVNSATASVRPRPAKYQCHKALELQDHRSTETQMRKTIDRGHKFMCMYLN